MFSRQKRCYKINAHFKINGNDRLNDEKVELYIVREVVLTKNDSTTEKKDHEQVKVLYYTFISRGINFRAFRARTVSAKLYSKRNIVHHISVS